MSSILLTKHMKRLTKSVLGVISLVIGVLLEPGSAISKQMKRAPESAETVPGSQISVWAGAQNPDDELSLLPLERGAVLRCGFQRLEGEATAEGLVLHSTMRDAVGEDYFRVMAWAVGRETALPAAAAGSLFASPTTKTRTASHRPPQAHMLAPAGTVQVADKLVRFIRPGVIEEYSVSIAGVRQDFLIERPTLEPQHPTISERPGELRLELSVSGARAETAEHRARLVLERTGRKIAYSRLRAADAAGRALDVRIEVPSADRIVVRVNDSGAVYPVRIDPTFTDENWSSLGGLPGANGQLYATAVDGLGNLYLGGSFWIVGDLLTSGVAKWNGSNWEFLGSGINGSVSALAVSGNDLYAGGAFTNAGGTAATNIAKWNGTTWTALGLGMTNPVLALTVSGSDLYAGGSFSSAGGTPANRIAKWNGSAWSALGSGLNNTVRALVASGTNLYAGGYFTTAGGGTASCIARWNGSSWSALGSGLNDYVNALASAGTNVYAAGLFTASGTTTVNRVARWDGSKWSALGLGLNNTVWTLAASGSDLYAGGDFTASGGFSMPYLARWNGSTWSYPGFGVNAPVRVMAVSGANLYVGGAFASNRGSYMVQWNGSNMSYLGSGIGDNLVMALAASGADLYAGGYFTLADGQAANRVARWHGGRWLPLGSGISHDLSFPSVRALTLSGTDLYAGGQFTRAGDNVATNVARWNGSSWSALGSGIGIGFPDAVNALAMSGTNLYAGGAFTNAGGNLVTNIAKWDGSRWSALGSGVGHAPAGGVYALAASGTDLYVGGDFTTAGTSTVNFIAKWNGSSWSSLGSGMNERVYALAVLGTDLYAGGSFTTAGGNPATNIAKWNGSTWSALGSGTSYQVNALRVSGSDIYAGGNFATAGGNVVNFIARWNGSNWSPLGSGANNSVNALAVWGGDLYAGGAFTTAGGKVSAYVAKAAVVLPANAISSPFLNGGKFVVRFDGTPGVAYTIEYTDNIVSANWLRATNLTAPSTDQGLGVGVFEFRDSADSRRFYRSVYPAY